MKNLKCREKAIGNRKRKTDVTNARRSKRKCNGGARVVCLAIRRMLARQHSRGGGRGGGGGGGGLSSQRPPTVAARTTERRRSSVANATAVTAAT